MALTRRDIKTRTLNIQMRPLMDDIGYEVKVNGRRSSIEKPNLSEAIGELMYQATTFYADGTPKHPIEMECDPVVFCNDCDIEDATHFSLCEKHRANIGS